MSVNHRQQSVALTSTGSAFLPSSHSSALRAAMSPTVSGYKSSWNSVVYNITIRGEINLGLLTAPAHLYCHAADSSHIQPAGGNRINTLTARPKCEDGDIIFQDRDIKFQDRGRQDQDSDNTVNARQSWQPPSRPMSNILKIVTRSLQHFCGSWCMLVSFCS